MPSEQCKSFLLHTCCAPCGIAVIDELRKIHDLVVYFYNPNIYPREEYEKRKAEVMKVCIEWNVPMIDGDYENEQWLVATKGLEQEPEGGRRCLKCIFLRLKKTAQLAKERGYELFGTTLTMSRWKNADMIHDIGKIIGATFNVQFCAEDWKTKGRSERGRTMVKERGIYKQKYCGCVYSLKNIGK